LAHQTASDVECAVIGNGVDNERFPRKPERPVTGPVRLISVCRMVPRKGLEYLIEAMQELKNDGIVLDLVGSGEDHARVEALVRSRGLTEHIKLPGYIASEFLYAHYHRADVFVLPSLSESFGQVLLEAMSCGLPIVATAVGGIPETVRDKTNGLLVPPRDSKALVEAIRWMAANRQQRERMGRANAAQAREHYSWSSVATRYEELYYRAVARRARAPKLSADQWT
jgi:glycosyltransferase involved in cell wall biosynthesis